MTAIVFLKKAYQLSQTKENLQLIPYEDPGAFIVNCDYSATDRLAQNNVRVSSGPLEMHLRDRSCSLSKSESLLDIEIQSQAHLAKFKPLEPMVVSVLTPAITSPNDYEIASSRDREQEVARIPEWSDGVFWKRYGNKIRVGQPGILLYTGR